LGCGRRRKGIFIWGGVCFHLGSSCDAKELSLFARVVLKDRTALGLTVARSVLVQDAQTKGVREVDMAVAAILV
jgi:hypothetical protein